MHEKNIDLLCLEGTRLLDVGMGFLKNMQGQQGVVADAIKDEEQTFDKKSIIKNIEVLDGERKKLENLEMVLAVVGTMKAGKSTTINAIVGTEVLPNRNRPMTALPTLIRHTSGQIDPILLFDNNEPINNLIIELHSVINNGNSDKLLADLSDNPDMKELLSLIKKKGKFNKEYKGAQDIFWFLKSLNDIVRLSTELNVDFPFDCYDEIHEMPVIEVEFAHLRQMEQSKGRLTLLDTPGPNESGQTHLRKMLREQLSKASAVLVVMDYTQLKSDADKELRNELKEIANVADGRLYALVNKFDQKDANGDDEEGTKKYISKNLMGNAFPEENVFPVSSKWAYLANRALHEIHIHGKLPSSEVEDWVADFGDEAIGRRWESKIEILEEVQSAAYDLWKESLFNAPMERVIKAAYPRAADYAIDSSAAKLIDIAEKLNNFLGLRESALSKNAEELKRQINSLTKDYESVGIVEENAIQQSKELLSRIDSESKAVFDETKIHVTQLLDNYFIEGKRTENKKSPENNVDKKNKGSKKNRGGKKIEGYDSSGNNSTDKRDFKPEIKIIQFSEVKSATELIAKISKTVEETSKEGETKLVNSIRNLQGKFKNEFLNESDKILKSITETMKGRMSADGFSVSLSPLKPSFPSLSISSAELLNGMVSEKTKLATRYRRKSSAWGWICEKFNTDDWGWASYQIEEECFEVDINKIKESVINGINNSFECLQKSIASNIQAPLNKDIENYFNKLKVEIEHIRGDLQQSIRDKNSTKTEQESLAKRITELRKGIPSLLKDSQELSADVKQLLKNEAMV